MTMNFSIGLVYRSPSRELRVDAELDDGTTLIVALDEANVVLPDGSYDLDAVFEAAERAIAIENN